MQWWYKHTNHLSHSLSGLGWYEWLIRLFECYESIITWQMLYNSFILHNYLAIHNDDQIQKHIYCKSHNVLILHQRMPDILYNYISLYATICLQYHVHVY